MVPKILGITGQTLPATPQPARLPAFLSKVSPGTQKPPTTNPQRGQSSGAKHTLTFRCGHREPQFRGRPSRRAGRPGMSRGGAGCRTARERGKRHATLPGGAGSSDGSQPFGPRTTRVGFIGVTPGRTRRKAHRARAGSEGRSAARGFQRTARRLFRYSVRTRRRPR